MTTPAFAASLHSFVLNEPKYLALLTKLIGVSEKLQNSPPQGLIPRENLASDIVKAELEPHLKANGGPLLWERIEFVEGRGNVIITLPGTQEGASCAFVGSHLDVVPANPEGWERNPFELIVEGDNLYGRGTTDCLGHVALMTCLLCSFAERVTAGELSLKQTLTIVFIAAEESSNIKGVGVDMVASKTDKLQCLKTGPIFWIDSADSQPCFGTAGNLQWKLKVTGKLFHSGLPHRAINPIELAMEAIGALQADFYGRFPALPEETEYNFQTSSTMKPTQVECSPGSLNQIPPWCHVAGDVRLTPFYDCADVKTFLEARVAAMNADIEGVPSRGPFSKYVLPADSGGERGLIEIEWLSEGENGIACTIGSPGNLALVAATKAVLGKCEPYSICGSLPLVREMQDNGFDLQISGYGLSSRYHADNEYCKLSDMSNAARILANVIAQLEGADAPPTAPPTPERKFKPLGARMMSGAGHDLTQIRQQDQA